MTEIPANCLFNKKQTGCGATELAGTIAVVGLSVVDTLWFNAMPESNRYKNVQAFNVVTLWIVAIVLIIKLVTM